MTETISGWLLDVYPNETNLTLWIIGEDGKRYRFVQDFSATIYAAGPAARLRALWKWLNGQAIPVHLSRTERRDILTGTGTFQEAPAPHPTGIPLQVQVKLPRLATVLAVEVLQPVKLDELFRKITAAFPDLTYYDADISIPLRYAARFDVFPLARVRLEVRGENVVRIVPLDTPWELEPEAAPLRMLSLEPDCDPSRREPTQIIVSYPRSGNPYESVRYCLPLDKPLLFLIGLRGHPPL